MSSAVEKKALGAEFFAGTVITASILLLGCYQAIQVLPESLEETLNKAMKEFVMMFPPPPGQMYIDPPGQVWAAAYLAASSLDRKSVV